MKNLTSSLFILATLLLSSCGGDSIENKPFTVKNVVSGNVLQLQNGIIVLILGIDDTPQSRDYLNSKVLNKRVKIRFDKKFIVNKYKQGTIIPCYLVTEDNRCLNTDMLKKGIASFSKEHLNDSLISYNSYASGYKERPTEVSEPSSKGKPTGEILDTKTISKNSEPSIFVVHSYDQNGNGIGQGTGFFIKTGNIGVSNHHVFEGGSAWEIKGAGGYIYPVTKILKKSKEFDFVIFEVDAKTNFKPLPIANDLPQKGEDIVVIGNPRGFENTVTKGIVSAFRTRVSDNDMIQIDAAISPGSSGSPVFNMRGEVIGIATLKFLECENCNVAVSIKVLNPF